LDARGFGQRLYAAVFAGGVGVCLRRSLDKAQAQNQGYLVKSRDQGAAPEPFHGYFFKILTRQGKHAPGGKYDYIINGNMIGGFALVAWPVEYGQTGIMTFIVNQQGRVYQKDLGPRTARTAASGSTHSARAELSSGARIRSPISTRVTSKPR